ncbi:MAG: GTPase ObgE [Clostridiales bacterium]|nr:GTPase ObgE [Clostridiales bacterium]
MDNKVFTDKVKITVKAGDGGDGMNSFKAYKGKPACGPDGGDGGDGGSVYFLGDKDMNDLLSFRFTSKYFAEDGERGGTNQCFGKKGKDMIIKVPCGTLVRDAESGKIICDVFEDEEKICVLEGGHGGKGNVRFTTARRHAPNFAQKGVKTKPHTLILEMKVIADAGLVGFPNVGKSTLLSKISAAKPKIADYHFTTLSPNLGVVRYYENSFVAADIPGLIEGAADGAGLGHDFLRHIERTRLLVHVLDISGMEGRDPLEDFTKINAELKTYSEKLAALPQLVALNKCDCFGAEENIKRFRKKYGKKYEIFEITALNGEGTEALVKAIIEKLSELPPVERMRAEEFEFAADDNSSYEIFRDETGAYVVVGGLVDMLCRNVALNNPDSMAYFQRTLKNRGVIKDLQKMGCGEGDTVVVGDVEFAFVL